MSCKNATCVVCVLETARMRFFSRRRDSGYKGNTLSPATMLQQRTTRARSQTGRYFSGPGACAANEKARRLVSSTPQEDWRTLARRIDEQESRATSYGCQPLQTKSRAGRARRAGLRDRRSQRPDPASRDTPPVQIVGCPARRCLLWGVGPAPRPNRGCRPGRTPAPI